MAKISYRGFMKDLLYEFSHLNLINIKYLKIFITIMLMENVNEHFFIQILILTLNIYNFYLKYEKMEEKSALKIKYS